MIPIKLRLSGFLSYRDTTELDFTGFDLACISGQNGAGKSSLLDAMTWALFGQARKRDEALINQQSKAAEVTFTFGYEQNVYRIQRSLAQGKATILEFQILTADNGWRPLTEHSLRETQKRIEQVLRLDYETFVNAAFFLQGKADQFTQQNAGKRKEVLSNVLGLEIWETYKDMTAERRKALQQEQDSVDGRLAEIKAELNEEPARKARLAGLETELGRLTTARKTQETDLDNIRRLTASLKEQRNLVTSLAAQLERSNQKLTDIETRLSARQVEREEYIELQSRATEVEASYQAWQASRLELERWDKLADQFHEQDKRRQAPLDMINTERARLAQERISLEGEKAEIENQAAGANDWQTELDAARKKLAEIETGLNQKAGIDTEIQTAQQEEAKRKAENERLRQEMEEHKGRIDQLEKTEEATCPLCGKPLSVEDRQDLIARLNEEGRNMGDRFRANKTYMEEATQKLNELKSRFTDFAGFEDERVACSSTATRLTERLGNRQQAYAAWKKEGETRLTEVNKLLEKESFAGGARTSLAKIDEELKILGYDPEAHNKTRRLESEQRGSEEDHRKLQSARDKLSLLEREINDLESQAATQRTEITILTEEHGSASAALAEAEAQVPDEESAYQELLKLQEQENNLNQEIGAARQQVSVLDDLRVRKADLEIQRGELSKASSQHKMLERAFGKDGVPALLIEQALPQIESKANELLERLSDGSMSVRFQTQAAFKDKGREDLKETLDIQISDNAGTRDYEMFSGGEAFRVNFAIRLALSEVLARRKGARLQTLVIDEGFGSQDSQGRQRLVEAIKHVQSDFAKILVITHLEELKDAFPNRIEVEKTGGSSMIRVI